jgi:hypothetical protein
MKLIKTINTVLLTILISIPLFSQQVITLRGVVRDASTENNLEFASINLLRSKISNVTNTEGVFSLKIPYDAIQDTIMVSFLGYKSKRISAQELYNAGSMTINLEQSLVRLNPVTIRPQDAASIVKMAVSRRGDNYSQEYASMTGFYREMIKKRNNYVSINEAVLDISKSPYKGFRTDRIGVFKARGNYDTRRIDTLLVKFQGGPNSALDLDIMKDPFLAVDPFEIEKIYDFKLTEPVTADDRLFYVIEFDEKNKTSPEIYFRGKLFIDAETFAIGRAEFSMNVENRENANRYFVRRKPTSLRMDVEKASYVVNYKKIGQLWYFDYSRTEVTFEAKWDKKWFSNDYTIYSELAITDISESKIEIMPQSRIRPRDIMTNRVNDFADPDFWQDYNIIEPDASIEKIISRILRQLRRR